MALKDMVNRCMDSQRMDNLCMVNNPCMDSLCTSNNKGEGDLEAEAWEAWEAWDCLLPLVLEGVC
jgi:hypothetical protein